MVDRNLQNPQSGSRRPHLHLEVPSKSRLPHVELVQGNASDCAERAHVRVVNAIQSGKQPTRQTTSNDLLSGHAARFAPPANPRSDDKVCLSQGDWFDQARQHFGAVAAVPIEKGDDRTAWGGADERTPPALR